MPARPHQEPSRPPPTALPEGARELFVLALDLDDDARAALLAEAELEDPGAGAEVRSLVDAWLGAPDFLDHAPLFAAEDTTGGSDPDSRPEDLSSLDLQKLLRSWDRYRLEERLGRGATSLVYRAVERATGHVVAIKFLVHLGEREINRFRREAEALARVSHPAVLELFDSGSVEGVPYLVTRLVSGPGLLSAPATLGEKVEIVRQVALGLEAAHQQKLVHRDIKPSNILLEHRDGAWRPFLADFGIARDSDRRGLTATGVLVGTPAYLAPERLASNPGPADARSDLYSLGVTFYELLTGRRPYESPWTLEMLLKIREGQIVAPREAMPELPRALETVLFRCLAADPGLRYPSARALADDLGRFLRGEALAPGSEAPRSLRSPRRRRLVLPGLAVVGLLILVTLRVREPQTLPGSSQGLDSSKSSSFLEVSGAGDTEATKLHQAGVGHLRTLDFARARVFFEASLASEPGQAVVYADLSRAWSGLGFDTEARQRAREALDLSRDLPQWERARIEGRFHHAAGDWSRAEEILSGLRRRAPEDLELGLELAAVHIGARQNEAAIELLEELRNLPPAQGTDPRIDLAEARAAEAMASYDLAEAAIERAIAEAERRGAHLAVARIRLQAVWLFHHRHEPRKVRAATEVARKAFVQAGDSASIAESLLLESMMHNREGHHSLARQSGQEAAVFYREIDHTIGQARALNEIAIANHGLEGDLEKSQKDFEEVLAMYRAAEDRRGTATSLNNLGLILNLRNRPEEAATVYQEAIGLQRAIGDREGLGRTLSNLSLILQEMRATPDALAALEESLAVRQTIGSPRGLALTQLNLGHLHRIRGDLDSSETYYRDCLQSSRKISWSPGEARGLFGLGWIAYLRHDLDRARELYQEALLHHAKSDAPSSPALTRINLAKTWLELGQPDHAVAAIPEVSHGGSTAWAHIVLARAEAERGQLEVARQHLTEAWDLREKNIGYSDLQVHIDLARAELRVGPEKSRAEILGILEETLDQARLGGLDTTICQALLTLAQAVQEPGSPLPEEARQRLQEVIEIAESRGLALYHHRAREALRT